MTSNFIQIRSLLCRLLWRVDLCLNPADTNWNQTLLCPALLAACYLLPGRSGSGTKVLATCYKLGLVVVVVLKYQLLSDQVGLVVVVVLKY